jgi:DNA mismatch repair protein MutL
MSENIIALLPEHVANQIAAGEVVQRPSSAVKELLENAIDAGAGNIKLIIKDAGKSLLQVIDNGKGMSPFDARMCFERHATSKIKSSDDLFKLTTKGFRGEALASIAAVAQVELKTRQEKDIVAQQILVEGGKYISQEECQSPVGTSFTVKNLFFNIPARRNFLKNDSIEQKHIIEEFERVALAHCDVHFTFISNGNEILNLPPGTLIQRIKQLYGNYMQKDLVPVSEDTPFLKIEGYACIPSACVKVKKEQFLFVNDRFIKSPFLNHAIYDSYKELIGFQSNPKFFIFLLLDPKYIDINIHPTKTEIKFTDERAVYMILSSVIKRALGKANAGPSLDFEAEIGFSDAVLPSSQKVLSPPKINYDPTYNPFNKTGPISFPGSKTASTKNNWEQLLDGFKDDLIDTKESEEKSQNKLEEIQLEALDLPVFQLASKYIVTNYNSNIIVIDQQRAHQRIVYEYYFRSNKQNKIPSQQLLFPEQIEFGANDFTLIKDLFNEFRELGFDIEEFGKNSVVINGAPSDLKDFNIRQTLEGILETYKLNTIDTAIEKHENLCRSLAKNISIKYGKTLSTEEMKLIAEGIFRCENPLYTADGKPVMMEIEINDLTKFFKK